MYLFLGSLKKSEIDDMQFWIFWRKVNKTCYDFDLIIILTLFSSQLWTYALLEVIKKKALLKAMQNLEPES